MANKEKNQIHRKFLVEYLGLNKTESGDIFLLPGSSDCSVFKIKKKIFRVGSKNDIENFLSSLNRFKLAISNYEYFFPSFEHIFCGEISIVQLGYFESDTFENLLLKQRNNDIDHLASVNVLIMNTLREFFEKTNFRNSQKDNLLEKKKFFAELLGVIKNNLKVSDRINKWDEFYYLTSQSFDFFSSQVICSLAHKDFSVGNILISPDGSGVKFIDPRLSSPYGEDYQSIGNIVLDLAAYYVSICRKELELKKLGSKYNFLSIKIIIKEEIDRYIQEGVFSKQVLYLSILLWYSVYSACKCQYCLSEEKKWLYEEMEKQVDKYLSVEFFENFSLDCF